jgi:hypothetical protein
MNLLRGVRRWTLAAAVCVGGVCAAATQQSDHAPSSSIVQVRRLTEDQYRFAIADVFGSDIKINGHFEPEIRRDGLLAVGSSMVTVTPAGAEQYDMMARSIATQVVDERHRESLLACKPTNAAGADSDCAARILSTTGRLLFRRPLSADELKQQSAFADDIAGKSKNFYAGIEASLSGMLVSPDFLFVVERGRPEPGQPAILTLDAYARAEAIALLLWDSPPDDTLLTAATRGDLDKPDRLARQVDRMMASPRFERGVRAFFTDMYGFDAFQTLFKDTIIYPKYTQAVAADAKEQTLRLLVDHLVRRNEDYRKLFTTRRTFLDRRISTIYHAPVLARGGWEAYDIPPGDARSGLLTQLSFLTLYSHPGRSSPTLRGKAIRQFLMCHEVPAPPPNVNFAIVQDTSNPLYRTARQRLEKHRSDPRCAGCHQMMDPLGLALENFDSSGEERDSENGAAIDLSGAYQGKPFIGAEGLGKALSQDPQITSCLVRRLYSYSVARALTAADDAAIAPLLRRFNIDGAFRPLVRAIATSDAFYRVQVADKPAQVASLGSPGPSGDATP